MAKFDPNEKKIVGDFLFQVLVSHGMSEEDAEIFSRLDSRRIPVDKSLTVSYIRAHVRDVHVMRNYTHCDTPPATKLVIERMIDAWAFSKP